MVATTGLAWWLLASSCEYNLKFVLIGRIVLIWVVVTMVVLKVLIRVGFARILSRNISGFPALYG
jgi:hypothetical protein